MKLKLLLREPLIHFLLMGAILFVVFIQFGDATQKSKKIITITNADLMQLSAVWLKRTGRSPTEEQREKQLEHYIREQVLYLEAMDMGLDKNDAIVRRRLAQKMQFIFDDLSAVEKPNDSELEAYLTTHAEQFYIPASITFAQIFLNPEKLGVQLQSSAEKILKHLRNLNQQVNAADFGDSSLLPNELAYVRKAEVVNMFGKVFAEAVFSFSEGAWQEPVMSVYGLHLVYVHSHEPQKLPELSDVRQRVESAWMEAKRKQANEIFYQSLFQQYEIKIDDAVMQNALKNIR